MKKKNEFSSPVPGHAEDTCVDPVIKFAIGGEEETSALGTEIGVIPPPTARA